ncbi:MAG: DUF4178 domain-containing protein [Pseudomonadota bacterium]
MAERSFNCPNCGAELKAVLQFTKLITCSYCDSAVFLDDDAVELAGKQGVMSERPCILQLGEQFGYREWQFHVVGHARFDYAHGYWDEFWVIQDGQGVWVSVDEGDIAVERPVELDVAPSWADMRLGEKVRLLNDNFVVAEVGKGTCAAIKGELPEVLEVGQSFDYAHLRAGGARLVTLEFDEDGVQATDGSWVDPFDVKRLS